MSGTPFPAYVDRFVADAGRFLEHFGCALEERPDAAPAGAEAREWQVTGARFPTFLLVHRTEASRGERVGRYRARARTVLPDEIGRFCATTLDIQNRFATLGAMVRRGTGVEVVSQALIHPGDERTAAGLMACALAESAASILSSVGRMAQPDAAPAARGESAWSDLDMEQLRYDWAHLQDGVTRPRGWSILVGPDAWLDLDCVGDNPHFGGGLLARLILPASRLGPAGDALTTEELNNATYTFDDAPMFGGWTRDGDRIVFVSFLPNLMKNLPDVADLVVAWAFRRCATLPEVARLLHDPGTARSQGGPR